MSYRQLRGYHFGAHMHANSLLSGVYYLSAPYGSGSLVLLDPRFGAQLLQLPLNSTPMQGQPGRV